MISPLLLTFLPYLALLYCAAAAAGFELLVRGRDRGDSGDFWARTLLAGAGLMAPLLLITALLPSFLPDFYASGRHPHLDLRPPRAWTQDQAYLAALAGPLLFWTVLLIVAFFRTPRPRRPRWLAGSVGFGDSRKWVILFTLPFLVIMAWGWNRLGGGEDAYPAALWAAQLTLIFSLLGVGLSLPSSEAAVPAETEDQEAGEKQPLQPWPQALAEQGIRTRLIVEWPEGRAPRPVKAGQGEELMQRLEKPSTMAPQLIETVSSLISGARFGPDEDRSKLVLAPDDCGQIECLAAGAALLWQRFREVTLVICAGEAERTAARLEKTLPAGVSVVLLQKGKTGTPEAAVWVTDAETLSERLIRGLSDSALVHAVGWVVWFDVHRYTGVLAANVWAISRRLDRILRSRGRLDLRTLVLGRVGSSGDAQIERFVRRLLPYNFSAQDEVRIAPFFRRPVHLHVLESQEGFSRTEVGRGLPDAARDDALVAAWSSLTGGWPTWLEVPREVNDAEANQLLRLSIGGREMQERLLPDRAQARAGVFRLRAGDVLSLMEMVCQGGRRRDEGMVHHEAVCRFENPYVEYLLQSLSAGRGLEGFGTSKRLVGAEARRSIIKHHLLLALAEREETGQGLKNTFLWEEDTIKKTLDGIYGEGRLERGEVRFLDQRGEMRVDQVYRNRLPLGEAGRPLDCVGADLMAVREAAGGERSSGVRMLVDPERLAIQAYPGRIFMDQGRRYRVVHWNSTRDALARGWVGCEQEGRPGASIRIRNMLVDRIQDLQPVATMGRRKRLIARMTADLRYDEEVTGVIRLLQDHRSGRFQAQTQTLDRPLTASFRTQGLILRFSSRPDRLTLISLCQALRTVLPVHLGVEEDALETVPIHGAYAGEVEIFGLAIVDLYPGGIGLVGAIRDDEPLIRTVLSRTRDWLAACDCAESCEKCLGTHLAQATSSLRRPDRRAALRILEEFAL